MSRFTSWLFRAGLCAGLLGFAAGAALAEAPNAGVAGAAQPSPQNEEQRVALVIGNSNYQSAPKLANPGRDAQSMAHLLI